MNEEASERCILKKKEQII